MIQVSKKVLSEKITYYAQELGLKNDEIAEKLNEEYGATEDNKLRAPQVAKLKDVLGLKGLKPKKKALFELVDDEVEEGPQEVLRGVLSGDVPPNHIPPNYSFETEI